MGQLEKRRGRPRTDIETEETIVDLLLAKNTPTQIHRDLVAKYGLNAPSVSTIIRIKRRRLPPDSSEPWTLENAESPHEIALVPPVLAFIMERTEGRKRHLSCLEAHWITNVRLAAPDLPLEEAYRLARLYIVQEHRKAGIEDLDAFLAFTPWRGRDDFDRFLRVMKSAHLDWGQPTRTEEFPGPDGQMFQITTSFSLAAVIWLAMRMQKGVHNEQAR